MRRRNLIYLLICPLLLVSVVSVWEVRPQSGSSGSQDTESFLFLTGKVLKSDGTASDKQGIKVDLICGGRVQQQVFTTTDGNFSFRIERMQEQGWTDASVGHDGALSSNSHWNSSVDQTGVFAASRFKTFNLSGCLIRLSSGQDLSGSEIVLSNRSVFDNPDVGGLILRPEGDEAGSLISLTSLAATPKARDAYQKAQRELARQPADFGRASKELMKAVAEYPEFAEAWNQLGEIQLQQNQPEAARESFEKAAASDPRFLKPYLSLARMALFDEDWRRAADLAAEAASLSPSTAQAHYYRGLATFALKEFDEAQSAFTYLDENGHTREYPLACFHLAIIHAQKGRIQEAGDQFQQYLRLMPQERFPPGQKEKIEQQLAAWEQQSLWKRQPKQ